MADQHPSLRGSDEVFILRDCEIQSLPGRPLRSGLFGRTLEDALQTLIERQPNIINGRQLEPGDDDPPRFVLLRREMAVGDWSLDDLLVDQKGVLTLVEAKLLQNPDSRRAVIGQIMEYAANAERSWGNGRIRQLATEYWRKAGKDVEDVLRAAFGDDVEGLWSEIETNLKRGKIRLIIAADELRPEVRRIIEFLNQQLKTVQVFGLEIRCYGEEPGPVVIASVLVGQTQVSADEKGTGRLLKEWTVDELRRQYDREPSPRVREFLDWAVDNQFVLLGKAQTPLFYLRGRSGERIATVYPNAFYVLLRESKYAGGTPERDRLVEELKGLGLYPADLDPQTVADGRNLTRSLTDLGDEEFAKVLDVCTRYCGRGGVEPTGPTA